MNLEWREIYKPSTPQTTAGICGYILCMESTNQVLLKLRIIDGVYHAVDAGNQYLPYAFVTEATAKAWAEHYYNRYVTVVHPHIFNKDKS